MKKKFGEFVALLLAIGIMAFVVYYATHPEAFEDNGPTTPIFHHDDHPYPDEYDPCAGGCP